MNLSKGRKATIFQISVQSWRKRSPHKSIIYTRLGGGKNVLKELPWPGGFSISPQCQILQGTEEWIKDNSHILRRQRYPKYGEKEKEFTDRSLYQNKNLEWAAQFNHQSVEKMTQTYYRENMQKPNHQLHLEKNNLKEQEKNYFQSLVLQNLIRTWNK